MPFSAGLASMRTATPTPVATGKGHDNQPFFAPGGQRLLFTGNRDGKQTDVYEFDVPGTRLVSFAQNEANGEYRVKTIDVDSRRIETLVATVEGSADRDYAWMPDRAAPSRASRSLPPATPSPLSFRCPSSAVCRCPSAVQSYA